MNKRILFFISTLKDSGGTERITVFLADKFIQRGYDVNILCWYNGRESFFDLNPKINLFYLFKTAVNIYTTYVLSLFRYRKAIRKIKPDIVIDVCSALSIISIPASIFLRHKKITWEHFNAQVEWNILTGKIARFLASKFASSIVVLTQTDKDFFIKKYKPDSILCIPNPLILSSSIKADLHQKNVLAIGRLTRQKGFDMLIQSWKIVENVKDDWYLTIVGTGSEEHQLKMQIVLNNLKRITIIPPTKHIDDYFGKSSIFVMSSRFEGLPLVLIEAQSIGLPIVSFNCDTGPRDIVSHNEDGLLIQPNDITELANGLIRLMRDEDLRKQMGQKALENSKRFEPSMVLSMWDDFFKQLQL